MLLYLRFGERLGFRSHWLPHVRFLLFLLNEVGWELQRTRTHLALAVLITSLVTYLVCAIWAEPRASFTKKTALYFGLGVFLGLGCLAKYNFVLLPAGLAIAGLSAKKYRWTVLSSPWTLFTLVVALAILTPHLLWVVDNIGAIRSEAIHKLGLVDAAARIGTAASFVAFLESVGMFFLMPAYYSRSLVVGPSRQLGPQQSLVS